MSTSKLEKEKRWPVFSRVYKGLPILHPKNIKYFFKDVKSAYKLVKYGHNDMCWIEFYSWFQTVIPNILEEMADKGMGYPAFLEGLSDWDNIKEHTEETDRAFWHDYLHEIAKHIRNSSDEFCDVKNEYEEEYTRSLKIDPGIIHINTDEEISRKYFNRELEIYKYKCEEISKALDMLKPPVFFNLWD